MHAVCRRNGRAGRSEARLKNWKCNACAASLAGVCALHALIPADDPQPVLFYQSDEHPERQPVPQPQQQGRVVVLSTGSSVVQSGVPRMVFASGDLVGNIDAASGTVFSIARSSPVGVRSETFASPKADTTAKKA